MKKILIRTAIMIIILVIAMLFIGCNQTNKESLNYDILVENGDNKQPFCKICCTSKNEVDQNGICNSCRQLSDEIVIDTNLANSSQTFVYTRENNYIYFGTYPQSRVNNANLTNALNQKAGALPTESNKGNWISYAYYNDGDVANYMWYIDLEYESEKYRGVYFTLYRPWHTNTPCNIPSDSQSVNGYTVDNVYWFKYEPIRWRIVNESSGNVTILSELILDSQDFNHSLNTHTEEGTTIYANNWEYSSIREWLNTTFYSDAFNDLQKEKIVETNVGTITQQIKDNILLLTYQEALEEDYGFNSSSSNYDDARRKKPSDYAQVQGVYVNEIGYGWWWLRSGSDYVTHNVARVGGGGTVGNYCEVYFTRSGVVPTMTIEL